MARVVDSAEIDAFCKDRYVVAGTGSSSIGDAYDFDPPLLKSMKDLAHKNPVIISGMAKGWDALIATSAISLGFEWVACVPSPDYGAYYWKDRLSYFNWFLENATLVEYVRPSHMGSNGRPGGANFDRNQRMVDLADEFFVYNIGSPGTSDCVRRIKKAQKPYLQFKLVGDS